MDEDQTDYMRYRGKCKEFCEKAIADDPTLTLVRGHYFCPIWGTSEAHWWTVRPDGTIFDPTAKQFGSKGMGIYTPFDGTVTCSQCGKELPEEEAEFESNYVFCSTRCHLRFVGLDDYTREEEK
jgi:endogenous inhibitor of DNA gyrase (YacG/DUF329 family)